MKIFSGNKRKGALDLSLSTIVVLIFAITVLGLGLVFIRGLFNMATDKVNDAIKTGEMQQPPTDREPFTVSSQEFKIKRGQSATVQLAVLNRNPENRIYKLTLICDINPLDGTPSVNFKVVPETFSDRLIQAGTSSGWKASITTAKNTPSGQYQCTAQAEAQNPNDETDVEILPQDFFIQVPSV